jgi:hypothetical protein
MNRAPHHEKNPRCTFERGEGAERCAFYKRAYESLCPAEWVEEWQELREQGLWWVDAPRVLRALWLPRVLRCWWGRGVGCAFFSWRLC